ncbi:unnamed protein product [Bursaphelenchus okinawaensis]|uniref:LIM zinc-binding domain-containing protein n=1 Tax=Bursaphelenchus okinawaensis TaxID=465554 RepID=A0A811KUL7_9BILA|nr:unnamed protein product [Bursaphelenchus okinawaensis]CAG9112178.1 unnamed protein product [Bursaphelenchus okinawaensis]
MSDNEDPYAVSSGSEDEDQRKPPPKIQIEGRTGDLNKIKENLSKPEGNVKDEERQKEIEALKEAKKEDMAKMKQDFEAGKSSLQKDEADRKVSLEGVGKDTLSSIRNLIESGGETKAFESEQRKEVESLLKSEGERKKMLAAFMEEAAKEPSNDCHICGKIVYNVERIIAAKKVYHNTCFTCCKCSKKLTPTTFNHHDGDLYCRAHYQEALHPEQVGVVVDEEDDQPDDDDEFSLVSKPKKLADGVVRSEQTTNIGDELAQLKSLREKKAELEQSAAEAQKVEKKLTPAEEIAAGRVKENRGKHVLIISLSHFRIATSGETDEERAAAEAAERQKEIDAIKGSVHNVKNKWKTGDVETAESKESEAKSELEALKGQKLSERFKEGAEDHEVVKAYDKSELDTAAIANARKSFLEGSAYQSGPVEKTAIDLEEIRRGTASSFKDRFEKGLETDYEKTAVDLDVQLGDIKSQLSKLKSEDQMTPEERADKKKKEIEEEFLRYKLARKLREKKNNGEEVEVPQEEAVGLDVEIKMAGKARKKFEEIDSNATPIFPKQSESKSSSKWDKQHEPTAEVVNRRQQQDSDEEDEDPDAFDVKNLMNKFKNLAELAPARIEKKLDDLEQLRLEARNLREKFEKQDDGLDEETEEKKRQLQEEFEHLKAERLRAKEELEAERAAAAAEDDADKDDVQVAADHASKMAAKWEKINKKEAKKAERSKMPAKVSYCGVQGLVKSFETFTNNRLPLK